ncbi:MAG: LacI family DNA-binding transcriptional regulator [Ruminococcus sp.]|jgi:LacI family transcriptional regulator|nr:LacI family DNA-binding transcriptional regulator [Ruminococcus sp.]
MAGTIQDIADRAGVSRGTVDRALNKRGRINPDVKRRILQIADEMEYVPRKRKSENKKKVKIGIVTQLSSASFMSRIRKGIQDAAKETASKDFELLIEECENVSEDSQMESLLRLEKAGVAGIAIMPVDGNLIRNKINELIEQGIKIVTFNTDIIGTRRSCFVGMDNIRSGRAAAGLMGLLTRKEGEVLAITGHFGNSVNNMRVEGFTSELKESFPDLHLVGVQSSFDEPGEVERLVTKSLDTFPDLKGIVVFSAGQEGVLKALAKQKIPSKQRPFVIVYDLTPENIAGLRNDGFDFVLDQNGYMQGHRALCILEDLIFGDALPTKEYYYTDIVIKTKYNI